eukprot:1195726-Prorocentrum_minimum.AAC.2
MVRRKGAYTWIRCQWSEGRGHIPGSGCQWSEGRGHTPGSGCQWSEGRGHTPGSGCKWCARSFRPCALIPPHTLCPSLSPRLAHTRGSGGSAAQRAGPPARHVAGGAGPGGPGPPRGGAGARTQPGAGQ